MKQKYKTCIFTSIFIVIIMSIGILTLMNKENDISIIENRRLSRKPTLKFETLVSGDYFRNMDNFMNDQLFGREYLGELFYKIENSLGKKEMNNIILGDDGYLLRPLNYNENNLNNIDYNINQIQKLNKFSKESNITLYVSIAPRQTVANKEKLPKYFSTNVDEYLDYFNSSLPKDVKSIDLRDVLYEKNKHQQLYYKTDHHWNMRGAYYAYSEIINVINKEFPRIGQPYLMEDFKVEKYDEFNGSLARASRNGFNVESDKIELWYPNFDMGVYGVKRDDNSTKDIYELKQLDNDEFYNKYRVYTSGSAYRQNRYTLNRNMDKPNILIIGDSYPQSNAFLFSQNFYRTYFLSIDRINSENFHLEEYITKREIPIVLFLVNSDFIASNRFEYNK